jgi:hypothetical protein
MNCPYAMISFAYVKQALALFLVSAILDYAIIHDDISLVT